MHDIMQETRTQFRLYVSIMHGRSKYIYRQGSHAVLLSMLTF